MYRSTWSPRALSGRSSDASRTEPRRRRRLAHDQEDQSENVNTNPGCRAVPGERASDAVLGDVRLNERRRSATLGARYGHRSARVHGYSSQRVAAVFSSRMQERDGLRSSAGGRSQLVPGRRLGHRGDDAPLRLKAAVVGTPGHALLQPFGAAVSDLDTDVCERVPLRRGSAAPVIASRGPRPCAIGLHARECSTTT